MKYPYKFTVFTPCYNSSNFIHRVYDSLKNQTFKDFEWLVINDASTDNTSDLIKEYIKEAPFDIQFIDLNKNQMLTKNINLAIHKAKGEMMIIIGHDDAFLPDSLQTFWDIWQQYGNMNIAGITCLVQNQYGKIVGRQFRENIFISNDIDVIFKQNNGSEKWKCLRTDVMLQYLQPEDVDIYIPESVMHLEIAEKYSMIYLNKALRIYYVHELANQSLSTVFSNRIPYPRGFRYAYLVNINCIFSHLSGRWIWKLRTLINYGRMSFHAKIGFYASINDLKFLKWRFWYFALLPLEYCLYFRDGKRFRD